MAKRLARILVILLVLAAAVLAIRRALEPKPVPVRVVAVERGVVESSVSNTKAGTVKARRRSSLAPEIGGSVLEILRRRGDHVKAGDTLVRLNDASLRADMALAERAYDSSVALHDKSCIAADRAKHELDHNRDLGTKQIVSADTVDRLQSVYDLALGDCKTSEAEIARFRAAVDVARTALDKALVRAPFDGVIAEMKLEVGEWITPSPPMIQMPTFVDLIDTSSLYVSAPMDEVDSARIQVEQRTKITLEPYPGRSWTGRIVRIAPYVLDVESQNRTVEIETELDDKEFSSKLLPGTSADVEVILDVRTDVLRVPTSALIEGGKVLAVRDGTLVEKKVETGVRNWDFTEVRAGLELGERIVVSLEHAEVKAGASVVVEAERAKP
jgi:HlyD family secretion protein